MTILPQSSFNSGEVTPLTFGRVDLAKYRSALETCRNMVVTPHGGVTRRPGTEYIATTKNGSEKVRLIPFIFNTVQAYILEAGPNYMRVYRDGGQVQTVDTETKLLLNMNGTQNSTTFTDESANTHAITANGNVVVDTVVKKFGTGSAKFDGTGDFLTAGDHADWSWGDKKITVEMWAYFSGTGADALYEQFDDVDNVISLRRLADGTIEFKVVDTTTTTVQINSGTAITETNTWYHIALIRGWGGDSDSWAITINGDPGTSVETDVSSLPDLTTNAVIGREMISGSTLYFEGQLDGYRITKAAARWTADFSANLPTEYPNSGSGGGGTTFELATPYIEADLADLQFVQSADTMYIVHPNYSPRKLTRTDHDAWTLTVISFTAQPSNWGKQSKALNGAGITQANPGVVTSDGHGLSNGDVVLLTNVVGMTEVNGFTFTVAGQAANTFQLAGVDTTNFTAYSSGGFWNEINTNPATLALHEERLFFSGEPNNPQILDASKAGDFEDMTTGVGDDDGFQYTIAADQVNAVRWMVSDKNLLLGTSDSPWRVRGRGGDTATSPGITPTSIDIKPMRGPGAQAIRPVSVGTEFVYIQNIGKKFRTLSYKFEDDAYVGVNLSVLAEHLTKNDTILEVAYQEEPYQIVWGVKDNGELIGLTYMLDHEVVGWHRHDTGTFENIATIPGTTDNEIWFVVQRTIDGSVTRYIERLKTFWTDGDEENAFYVDSGLTYDGVSATTISGLDHLEAETVMIWSNGAAVASKTVSSGSVTLDAATTKAHFGIGMTSDVETLRLDPGDGSFQGKEKIIYELVARVFETIGFQYGKDSSSLDTKAQTSLTSDDVLLSFEGVFDTKGQVFIRKTDGGPLTLLSLLPKFEALEE